MDGHRGAQFNGLYTHIGCGAMPGFQNVVNVYATNWVPNGIDAEADKRDPLVKPVRRVDIRNRDETTNTSIEAF